MKNKPKCTPGNRICGKRCINENQTCLTDNNNLKYDREYTRKESAKINATYNNKNMTLREKDARFKKIYAESGLKYHNDSIKEVTNLRNMPINADNIKDSYKWVNEGLGRTVPDINTFNKKRRAKARKFLNK